MSVEVGADLEVSETFNRVASEAVEQDAAKAHVSECW